jgi:hypothetical protein
MRRDQLNRLLALSAVLVPGADMKDLTYTAALVRSGLVDLTILAARLKALPSTVHPDRVNTALKLVETWRQGT